MHMCVHQICFYYKSVFIPVAVQFQQRVTAGAIHIMLNGTKADGQRFIHFFSSVTPSGRFSSTVTV